MKKITFLFKSSPHATTSVREGIEALLACSSITEDIQVFFIGSGVGHLISGQDTTGIKTKDYAPIMRLLDVYGVENIYACRLSLERLGLLKKRRLIEVKLCGFDEIRSSLRKSKIVVQF